MSDGDAPPVRAVVIAPSGATGPLRVLLQRLAGVGIEVEVVDDVAAAADAVAGGVAHRKSPPCVVLDLRDAGEKKADDVRRATDALARVLAAIPGCLPIVIAADADAAMIVACMRGGAGDVIDIEPEGTAVARQVVERVFARQRDRAIPRDQIKQLRGMVEDLLKDLIRTERRSIQLEEQLARKTRDLPPLSETRPPTILLVEPDRALADWLTEHLEEAGVTTFAYVTAEEAVRGAVTLTATSAPMFDLALVAAPLPDADGLDTLSRLRERAPGLPGFLMTADHDADLAARAADLGVVGFVHKPVTDLDEVVERLAALARESLSRQREHAYLEQIKARHERVLARYRALRRDDET